MQKQTRKRFLEKISTTERKQNIVLLQKKTIHLKILVILVRA
jgi:hypothetical protein